MSSTLRGAVLDALQSIPVRASMCERVMLKYVLYAGIGALVVSSVAIVVATIRRLLQRAE